MTASVDSILALQLDLVAAPQAGNMRRLAPASMVGTSLEWYGFVIYNWMVGSLPGLLRKILIDTQTTSRNER